jgi:hypothetical protein
VTKPLVESGEWLVAWRQRITTGQVFTVMSRTVTLFGDLPTAWRHTKRIGMQ